jgi:hypothetical protein
MHRAQLQIGHNDRLQVALTEASKCMSFRKGENHRFMKVYTSCSIYRLCTYAGCNIDKAHIYTHYNIYRSRTYSYRLNSGTILITCYWYRLVTCCWHILVHVYNGISHRDNMVVVSSFDTYISRRLDGARIGGCSHLSVVAEERRGL